MAKLLEPDFISLQVRNLPASRVFYTEMFGFTLDPRFNTPDVVLFDSRTIPFALSKARVNLDEAPQPGWGRTLWIDCDHVDELHATLEAAGVTIITPPSDGPFGRTFLLADPDGYQIPSTRTPGSGFLLVVGLSVDAGVP